MAWAFVGVSAVVQVTATSHALTEPAGCQAGDLLVAVISSRIASTTSITLPAGWTLVAESKTNNVVAAATTSEASGMMAYIVRGDTAPALTFTHPTAPSVAVGRIVAYRGGDIWEPFDVGVGAKTGTAITAVSTTGLTTTQANDLIVKGVCSGRASAFSAHDAATDPTTSSGTNSVQTAAPIVGTWQERQDATTTTGADTALAIADAIRGTAGATGVLTCTASVSGGHAQVAGAFKIEPVETPGSSTIAQTGSALDFAISSAANSGTVSSTITVPSDAQIVVVGLKGWCSTAPYFTNMTFTKGGADTAMTRVGVTELANGHTAAIFYLVLPDTGTNKSLKFDWAGAAAPGESPLASVTFWKGIDTASPVRSSGGSLAAVSSSAFKTRTSLMTAQNGDLAVCFVGGDCLTGDGTVDTWYNLNLLTQCTKSADRHDGAWATFAPSQNLYVGADAATGMTFGVCAAIVLQPVAPAGIYQTGSALEFQPSIGNTGTVSSTITVPADAELVIACIAGYGGTANYFTTGGMTFTKGGVDTAMTVATTVSDTRTDTYSTAMFYLALPDTGANKSLKFDWAGSAAPSHVTPKFVVSFWKGIDTASPVRDADAVQNTSSVAGASTPTLTAQTGDKIVGFAGWFVSGVNGSVTTWSNLTTILNCTNTANADAALGQGDPTGNTSVGVATGTSLSDGSIVAIVLKPSAGLADIDGDLDVDETIDVFASTGGLVRWQATLADTEDPDVAAINATVRWAAPLATTEGADVAALTGNVARIAVLATREGDDVTLVNGTVVSPATGDLATTEAADTAALLGTISWQATLGTTEAADVAAFLGVARWAATLVTTEAPDVAAFTGTTKDPASGPLATREDPDVAAFTGTIRWQATLATVEAADAAAFLGVTHWVATLATVEAPDVALLNGVVRDPIGATLGAIESADVGAFTGNVYVPAEATLATTEAADVAAFTGGVQVAGTLGTIEASDVGAFTGAVRWSAALATTEAPDVAAFLGATRWIATLATTEALDVAALTGVTRWSGTLAASEAPDTAALTGAVRWAGALATVEAPDVAAFTGGIYASGPLAVTELPDVGAFLGGIYATGTLATTEAPDVAAFLGTAFGAGINANLAATEEADKAALTGQVSGVAGVLAASEPADVGAFLGATRWVATLATIEAADAAAFLGAAGWVATLATTEAKDVAALVGAVRWVGALAASESPDVAAFTGMAGALPEGVVLAAIEAPDVGAFTGSTLTDAALVTTEAPDLAAFAGGQVGTGILDTTEAPDRAAFTELPPDIADTPGRILSSDPLRVRSLAHGERVRVLAPQTPTNREMMRSSARVRSLKYPIPRTHVLIKVLGTKTLTGA